MSEQEQSIEQLQKKIPAKAPPAKSGFQHVAVNSEVLESMPPIVHGMPSSPGQPLDARTREFTEPLVGHDFSGVRIHSVIPGIIQTKLTINQPGDRYEQEADRVAELVMRMPEIESQQSEVLRRQPEEEEEELQRQPMEEEEIYQAKESPGQTPGVTSELDSRINSLKGDGQPLSESTRAFMEPRFGYDFSHVRIHNNASAAEVARAVHARAFTLGRDVVFGAGQYVPETTVGKRLLAHELTHVVQQIGRQVVHIQRQSDKMPSPRLEMPSPKLPQPARPGLLLPGERLSLQSSLAQIEWEARPNIRARYGTWQAYERVRNQVAGWTNPRVSDPDSYIESAIEQWNNNPQIHRHFGNNFDGDPHRSYLNLKRLYEQRGITDPANYFASNIVGINFYNINTVGHQSLRDRLREAQRTLTANGHNYVFDVPGSWAFVPRTLNRDINALSNHALGTAIDLNPGSNPQIYRDTGDILVIDAVCSQVLGQQNFLHTTDYLTLKRASDYFQSHFNDAWVTQQERLLSQKELQVPPPPDLAAQRRLVRAIRARRNILNQYAAHGFLNLTQELVNGLQNAGLQWGGEYTRASKDFMHFEDLNP